MRMMMKVIVPVDAGNRAIEDGSLAKTMMGFIDQHKPEAAYFVAEGGKRTALFVFDLKDATFIPLVAEPFFMHLDAEVHCTPAMNPADLKTGLERLAAHK